MPTEALRQLKSHSVGRVITMTQIPRRNWNRPLAPFPGQILFLRQREMGRIARDFTYQVFRHVDQRLGLRRWVTRTLSTGRVVSYARILVERTADSLSRLAPPKIFYRRPDPLPRPKARVVARPDLPSPRRSEWPEPIPMPKPRRREEPAVSTLRRGGLYDRWSRR